MDDMRTITVERTVVETITVPEPADMVIGLGDSGPGGDPQNEEFVMVNGAQLCLASELSPEATAAFKTVRAAVYAKYLQSLGITP